MCRVALQKCMQSAALSFLACSCLMRVQGKGNADHTTDEGPEDSVQVETFEWTGGKALLKTTAFMVDKEPEDPNKRRLQTVTGPARRATEVGTGSLLDALWDRPRWRDARFNLHPSPGEHPCFAGFKSMIRDTDRCHGFVRQYPGVGSEEIFLNTGVGGQRSFTLRAVVAQHINVWLEQGTTEEHADVSKKAARIFANEFDIPELRPAPGSKSWMEHECKVMGSMPFMYTCSDRINILVQECRMANAWVRQSDYLRNFPDPATNQSVTNHDIIFYMCKELIDANPNPYAAANTFAHELAHVIQGGFGFSFNAMTEGGATWLEGSLLGMPPRPMVYAWGFRDWNRINAAHFYANTKELNSRKFYQIHAMFLTYLSQDSLLGDAATSALQNYQTFEDGNVPWGRMAYDYFLGQLGSGRPSDFATVRMDTEDTQNAFASALLDFRVALASQCITDAARRPTEPRYLMPQRLRDQPFWDCSSYPTFWSSSSSAVRNASADISYGGAAVFRLAAPSGATVSLAADADPQVRTKVLAAGTGPGGVGAEVRELVRGESATFSGGARELFVVQVNVDPRGETISPLIWRRSTYNCEGLCKGHAWTTAVGGGRQYPDDSRSSLRSPVVHLPDTEASLSFVAMWDMEEVFADGSLVAPGCAAKGFDGVQVRLHVYEDSGESQSSHRSGDEVHVLRPLNGYGAGPNNETGIYVLTRNELHPENAPCEYYEGWTGRSLGASGSLAFSRQRFSLTPFAGKQVRVEILFASDRSVGGEGFWVDDISIQAGGKVVFSDDAEDESPMFEHAILTTPAAGALGTHDGVPVVVDIPQGHKPDRSLEKAYDTRTAPWSAAWHSPPRWVGLRGFQNSYVAAESNGAVLTSGQELRNSEKFQLIHNDCGSVSLKSYHGKYLSASADGVLSAKDEQITRPAKFQMVLDDSGSVSLKTYYGKYLAAEVAGGVSANADAPGKRGEFRVVYSPQDHPDEVSLRRAYLGWSYSAAIQKRRTALLHPWQEACMRLHAPFQGRLRHATLFLLVDKMGVGSVTLTARSASPPYARLGGGPWVSPSPGVADPGIHRFSLRDAAPVLQEGEAFLLCAGVGALKPLPADDPRKEPFLHLPLTNVSTAASPSQPGATFLLATQDHGAMKAGDISGLDPWKGHTFTLRAEFVEEAGATAASVRAKAFLAAKPESTFWP